MSESEHRLNIDWRGRERYAKTWDHQLALHSARREGTALDTLVLVEHEPVITLGRQGDEANLLLNDEMLEKHGVDFHRVERGGDITFHGPGQLVGYPVLSLRQLGITVRDLMRNLEEALIRTVAEYGIEAGRIEGLTGVWHGDQKLAALGVAVKGGVSFHGFALNVDTDLSYFQMIVPCGITGKEVASISTVLGRKITLDDIRPKVEHHIREVFGYGG